MKPPFGWPRARALVLLCAVTSIRIFAAENDATAPVAKITAGQIRGKLDQKISVFKGIPYGDDTAKHRFQPPVPPPAWDGVRDMLEFAPMAPQAGGRRTGLDAAKPGNTISEDCLHLNVWTPALRDGKKR